MIMATIYEEIFEGKKSKTCEECAHYDACHEYSNALEMNAEECDAYEKDGQTLYDELFEN